MPQVRFLRDFDFHRGTSTVAFTQDLVLDRDGDHAEGIAAALAEGAARHVADDEAEA